MWTTTRRVTVAAAGALLLLSGCGAQPPDVVEPTRPAESSTDPGTPSLTEEPTQSVEEAPSASTTDTPTRTSDNEPTTPSEDPTTSADGADGGTELITGLTLCGDETYDVALDLCPETTVDFTTSALHCTATAQIEQAGVLDVRFYRDGGLVYTVGGDIPAEGVGQQVPLFADSNVGELDLPGGTWTCEVTLPDGSTNAADTTVSGPTEPFSQGRACDNSQVFSDGAVTHCTADAPVLPTDTPEIGCSGVLVDSLDTQVEVWAEYETQEQDGEALLGTLESTSGILVVHGTLTSGGLTGDPEFAPGDYSCRFMVDGAEAGSHDFRVG